MQDNKQKERKEKGLRSPEEKVNYIRLLIIFILGFLSAIAVMYSLSGTLFVAELYFMFFMLIIAFVILFLILNRLYLKLSWLFAAFFFLTFLFNLVYMRISAQNNLFDYGLIDLLFNIFWVFVLEYGIFISIYNMFEVNKKDEKKFLNIKINKENLEKKKALTRRLPLKSRNVSDDSKKGFKKKVSKKEDPRGKSYQQKTKGIRKLVKKSVRQNNNGVKDDGKIQDKLKRTTKKKVSKKKSSKKTLMRAS